MISDNFLSPQDCDALIQYGGIRLKRSETVGNDGMNIKSDIRISRNTFFLAPDLLRGRHSEMRGESALPALLQRVNEKVEAATMMPSSHMEMLQVQRYSKGGMYEVHHDGEERPTTALLYLTDVEDGGETVFPFIASPNLPPGTLHLPPLLLAGREEYRLEKYCMENSTALKVKQKKPSPTLP